MMLLVGLMPGGIYEPDFGIMELSCGIFVGLLIVLFVFSAPMVAAQICALEVRDHPGSRRHFLTWLLALLQAPISVALYMVVRLFLKLLHTLDTQSAPAWVDWAIKADRLYAIIGFGCLILYSIGLVIACVCCRYTIEKKVFIIILMGWQVIFWTLQLLMTLGWLRD
ncbi:MAG: hypothetical protein IKR13_03300 [Victivallales bacterium]|nr:hypothetical protein [Victivallales bacterium]